MKTNLRYFMGAMAVVCCSMASAQNLNSAYFLDGYTYGHRMNPAKDYDRKGYVSIPVLGNINMGMSGNLAATDVLKFNNEGRLTTFLHPDISVAEALSGFSSTNHTRMDMNMDILGFGFHAWGGFNTFNVSMRSNLGFSAPYELFEAAKSLTNKDYDLSGLRMDASAWAEIGFGHSRQVNDAWRVGGKLKVLLGGGHVKVNMENAALKLAALDKWILTADAQAEVSIKGFTWGEMDRKEFNDGTPYEQINFDNVDVDGAGLNGWGLGFDLGAEWDLGEQGWLEGMTVSASLLDLGFISWNETHVAQNLGKEIEFTGLNDFQVNNGTGTPAGEQTDGYADRFSALMALQDGGVRKSTSMLGATLNIGVEYQMPFYKKLSAGFLSTTRIQGGYSWNEERFSATVSPVKWFEASINVGFGTMGTSFGWVANIHPKGFNLFLGMDHMMGKFSKQGMPLSSHTGLTMGINIPFGNVHVK